MKIIIIKILLLLLQLDVSWIPFITTDYNNQKNIIEAQYLSQNGYDPYQTENIFQKPLLLYFLMNYGHKILYIIIDFIIPELIILNFGQKQGYSKTIRLFYHLNPITLIGLYAQNTDGIDYVLILLSIYLSQLNQQVLSSITFGMLLYLNPQYFILLSVFAVILRKQNNRLFILKLILFILFTSITVVFCLWLSFQLTQNWNFLNSYIDLYFPKDHRPTIGFLWALYSGLFSKYKILYHALFMIFPFCQIIPFYNIFIKYGDNKQNYLGFMLGLNLFTTYLYFQQVTILNLVFTFMVFFQRYDYVVSNMTALGTIYTPPFIIFLCGGLQLLWTHSFTGNPNFAFFQIFVAYSMMIVMVTESLREMLKKKYYENLEERLKRFLERYSITIMMQLSQLRDNEIIEKLQNQVLKYCEDHNLKDFKGQKERFEQPSAKLLYIINEMHKLQLIHTVEKNTLKQFVFAEHQAIFELLNKYPTSETEIQLADALLELLRGPNSPTQPPQHSQKVEDEEYDQKGQNFEEIQSPLGNQLMLRKKQRQNQNNGGGGLFKMTQILISYQSHLECCLPQSFIFHTTFCICFYSSKQNIRLFILKLIILVFLQGLQLIWTHSFSGNTDFVQSIMIVLVAVSLRGMLKKKSIMKIQNKESF
ncbi:hypothetical protein pb186bvf_005394 [Paramecium bursaria]